MLVQIKNLMLLLVASAALMVTDAHAVNVNFTVEEMFNPDNTIDPPAIPSHFISESFVRNDGTILGAMNVGGDIDFHADRTINGVTFYPSAAAVNASLTYDASGAVGTGGITIGYASSGDVGNSAAVSQGTAHGFDPTDDVFADFRRLMKSQVRSGRGGGNDPSLTGKTDVSVSGLTTGLSYRIQLLIGTNSSEDRSHKIVQGTDESDQFWVGWTQVSASCNSCGPRPTEGNSVSVLAEFVADAGSIDLTVQPIDNHRAYLNGIIVSEIAALGLPGDFDADTDVDGDDFLLWQRGPTGLSLTDWQSNYGTGTTTASVTAVPEPGSALLLVLGSLALLQRRRA